MKKTGLSIFHFLLILFILGNDRSISKADISRNMPVDPDPFLEPGFPLKALHLGGRYYGTPYTTVGNIDNEPTLEIIVTGLADGPVYAWNSDGSLVPGWPLNYYDDSYPAIGNLSDGNSQQEIFMAYHAGMFAAMDGSGIFLPGWPLQCNNGIDLPSLADIDGDGIDEIFLGQEDSMIHAFKADGKELPGWPVYFFGAYQSRSTPAIVDLNKDGNLDIVAASGTNSNGVYIFAYNLDGSFLAGFPMVLPSVSNSVPVIGDVDGDGDLEIVFIGGYAAFQPIVYIVSFHGTVERGIATSSDMNSGGPIALADLDGDMVPEIVVQTNNAIDVWKGNGTAMPGWPIITSESSIGYSAPVVGDVDGDQWPDIVVTINSQGMYNGSVAAFNRYGQSIFSRYLPIGWGGIPAIADIDLDKHNEIIVIGTYWDGYSGYYDKVWAYDLKGHSHGKIHWGQFQNGVKHQGVYIPQLPPLRLFLPLVN